MSVQSITVINLILIMSYYLNGYKAETIEFTHETCVLETLGSNVFKSLHSTEKFYNKHGILEFLVRFKGIADGHIALLATQNASNTENRYTISLGSYNNKVSEIRRERKPEKLEFKINTPFIMSNYQFRGFLIRYNQDTGGISIFSEGSDLPLLHLLDPEPLEIKYFSFATWHNRLIQVAFDCQAKDDHSHFSEKISNKIEEDNSKPDKSKNLKHFSSKILVILLIGF